MQKNSSLLALVTALVAGSTALAQDAETLAAMPRDAFLETYFDLYQESLSLQKDLLERFSPGFGDYLNADPLTAAEEDALGCVYDQLDAIGQVKQMAEQVLVYDLVRERMDADPSFDFATLVLDPEALELVSASTADELLDATSECDLMQLATGRMEFTPELWTALGEAAEERGYNEN